MQVFRYVPLSIITKKCNVWEKNYPFFTHTESVTCLILLRLMTCTTSTVCVPFTKQLPGASAYVSIKRTGMSLKVISPGPTWLLLGIWGMQGVGARAGSSLIPQYPTAQPDLSIWGCLARPWVLGSPWESSQWMAEVSHDYSLLDKPSSHDGYSTMFTFLFFQTSWGRWVKEAAPGQVTAQFMNNKVDALSLHWISVDTRLSLTQPFLYYAFTKAFY